MKRQGQPITRNETDVWRAWMALVGPSALYTCYFITVYLLAEAGCKLDSLRFVTLFGVSFVTALTVGLGIVAGGPLLLLVRLARTLAAAHDEARQFMGRAGLMACGLVAFLIVATIVVAVGTSPC